MKHGKRVLSVVLCLLMLVAVVPVMEASATYENLYKNTGNQRTDIIGVAKTQVGYTEESGNNNKYGSYFGNNYASWCAYFIVWCARQANIDSTVIKTTGWADADDLGVTYKARGSYTPQSGDIIIFDWSPYNTATPASAHGDHVGLVEYVSDGYVHTIEGNSNDAVRRCSYSLTYSEIKGYGVPNYQSTVHTHSYKEGYEGAHPHRYYKKCSCGDWYYTGQNAAVMTPGYEAIHPHRCYETCSICKENFLTGATTTISSCLECNRPSKPSINNLKSIYCFSQTISFTWMATTNTTHYNVVIQKKQNGNWTACKRTNYASSGISYHLDAGDYRVELQSYNSNKWESDGSDWLHTLSSWQYFSVINHTYNTGTITKAATCVATGIKAYTCTVCNATKTETIAINSSNHVNKTNVAATASTCTVKGYTAGVYCNDCKKYISGHAEQPLAAHKTTTQNAKAATCTAEGYTGDQVCSVCKQTITKGTAIAKKAHTLTTVNQKAAGCTTAGYTGDQVCTTCKQTITKGSAINALGHANADSNGNCTRCGTHIKDVTPSQPSNPQPNPNACKYCGQVHTGPFGWLIKFFHSILAIFKR